MPQVKLFGILRRYAGASQIEVNGATARAILELLCTDNPDLHTAIWEGSALRRYVRVMVNGHDIELVQGLDTPIAPDDEIAVFPPIAGGQPVATDFTNIHKSHFVVVSIRAICGGD